MITIDTYTATWDWGNNNKPKIRCGTTVAIAESADARELSNFEAHIHTIGLYLTEHVRWHSRSRKNVYRIGRM